VDFLDWGTTWHFFLTLAKTSPHRDRYWTDLQRGKHIEACIEVTFLKMESDRNDAYLLGLSLATPPGPADMGGNDPSPSNAGLIHDIRKQRELEAAAAAASGSTSHGGSGLPIELETIKEECMEMADMDMASYAAAAAVAAAAAAASGGGGMPGTSGGLQGHPGLIKTEKEKGTFWPAKPKVDAAAPVKASTVLTNLQRGNIPTILQTVVEPVVQSVHQRAGQGELRATELEEKGMIIDERDHNGKTPLMWSAAYGQTPTVTLLLRKGADVNAVACESETALHLAASNGHHDCVRMLLTYGAKVDALDENSCTPLMFAAMANHPHSVNELLTHKANITLTNINGQSALALAVRERATLAQTVLENHIANLLKSLTGSRHVQEPND